MPAARTAPRPVPVDRQQRSGGQPQAQLLGDLASAAVVRCFPELADAARQRPVVTVVRLDQQHAAAAVADERRRGQHHAGQAGVPGDRLDEAVRGHCRVSRSLPSAPAARSAPRLGTATLLPRAHVAHRHGARLVLLLAVNQAPARAAVARPLQLPAQLARRTEVNARPQARCSRRPRPARRRRPRGRRPSRSRRRPAGEPAPPASGSSAEDPLHPDRAPVPGTSGPPSASIRWSYRPPEPIEPATPGATTSQIGPV